MFRQAERRPVKRSTKKQCKALSCSSSVAQADCESQATLQVDVEDLKIEMASPFFEEVSIEAEESQSSSIEESEEEVKIES